jgi:hypothetical protein
LGLSWRDLPKKVFSKGNVTITWICDAEKRKKNAKKVTKHIERRHDGIKMEKLP